MISIQKSGIGKTEDGKNEMILLLIRHAKAEDFGSSGDGSRALTAKGQLQSRQVGRFLKERDLLPDLVLHSPLVRARETAEIFCQTCGADAPVQEAWLSLWDATGGGAGGAGGLRVDGVDGDGGHCGARAGLFAAGGVFARGGAGVCTGEEGVGDCLVGAAAAEERGAAFLVCGRRCCRWESRAYGSTKSSARSLSMQRLSQEKRSRTSAFSPRTASRAVQSM